jgi:hypothetical protein
MYKLVCIGVDQSYTRTGISIAVDGKLRKVYSIKFNGCSNKTEKRMCLRQELLRLLEKYKEHTERMVVICERIRTFTGGSSLRPDYLKSTGALIATIVDTAYCYNVKVFSVDTRAWKSKIVGTTKGEGESKLANKIPTLKYVKCLGFDCCIGTDRKGNAVYDDDAADSACIALYAFLPKKHRNLILES